MNTKVEPRGDGEVVPFYVIHQAGKVASQTLAWTIVSSDPSSRVERHHYLEPSYLAEVDRLCDLEKGSPQVASLRKQTAEARNALTLLSRQSPSNVWVLTGIRDPLDFAISAFFQNLTYYFPEYVWPAPDEQYDKARFDIIVDDVIKVFADEFAAFVRRTRDGIPDRNVHELEARRKLQNMGEWFDRELQPVFGVDIYTLDIGSRAFVRFTTERGNFLLYRMEGFAEALPALVRELPLPAPARLISDNLSSTKDYAVLYQRFRERFVPTDEMVEYYYGSKFFAHCYAGQEPLYSKHRQGSRALV